MTKLGIESGEFCDADDCETVANWVVDNDAGLNAYVCDLHLPGLLRAWPERRINNIIDLGEPPLRITVSVSQLRAGMLSRIYGEWVAELVEFDEFLFDAVTMIRLHAETGAIEFIPFDGQAFEAPDGAPPMPTALRSYILDGAADPVFRRSYADRHAFDKMRQEIHS